MAGEVVVAGCVAPAPEPVLPTGTAGCFGGVAIVGSPSPAACVEGKAYAGGAAVSPNNAVAIAATEPLQATADKNDRVEKQKTKMADLSLRRAVCMGMNAL